MFQKISMSDLNAKLKTLSAKEIILDVRSSEEYLDGHVPGSTNIPYDEVEGHFEDLKKLERVYIHCQAGKRAQIAAQTLVQKGLKNLVCVSQGGMGEWIEAGFPVEKGKSYSYNPK
ncbi:MAG: rhodanese-like domain-containing protein [Bdellovibrio sp.]|nr:rhodanese-like domain-containing protein [Bdellovibrio sp.]